MRTSLRLFLSFTFVAHAWAQQIAGPVTARSGEQHFYRLPAPLPIGEFRWHLEWNDANGRPQSWEGNENRPALNLTFPDQSGSHRLWVVTSAGNSSPLAIEVAPSVRELATTPVTLAKPPLDVSSIAVSALIPSSLPRSALPALPEPPPAIPSPPTDPAPANMIVTADDRDVIDLVAVTSRDESTTAPNPFRVRYQPKLQTREIALNVGLVHVGQNPSHSSVTINGEFYGIGDAIETFTISAISPEWIELRTPQLVARLPVQDRPIVLRFPR